MEGAICVNAWRREKAWCFGEIVSALLWLKHGMQREAYSEEVGRSWAGAGQDNVFGFCPEGKRSRGTGYEGLSSYAGCWELLT